MNLHTGQHVRQDWAAAASPCAARVLAARPAPSLHVQPVLPVPVLDGELWVFVVRLILGPHLQHMRGAHQQGRALPVRARRACELTGNAATASGAHEAGSRAGLLSLQAGEFCPPSQRVAAGRTDSWTKWLSCPSATAWPLCMPYASAIQPGCQLRCTAMPSRSWPPAACSEGQSPQQRLSTPRMQDTSPLQTKIRLFAPPAAPPSWPCCQA